jgi:HEAT repeat protein
MPPDAAFPFISIHGMVKPPPKVTPAQFLRMKSTASAGLTAMGAAAFDPIVNVMLKLPNPEARAEGAHLLGAVADQTVLPPAAPLADDKAQVVVAPLIRLLTSDPEWTVQQRAAASLGLLALSKQKLAAGEDMTVPVIRAKCVAIKDGALPPLIAALRHPRTEVRAAAAQALGMLRDPVAAQPLVDTLVNRRHGAAAEIGMALERLGTPAIAPLVPALGNPEDEVRLVATRTIAAIGSRAAIHPLAGRLRDANVLVRQAAARALKAIFKLEKDPTVVGDLQAALNDSDWRVYEDARDALTNLGEAGAPALVAALGSPDIRVAFTAQQGLTAIGLPAAPRLLDALGSGQGGTALWAAVALGDMGPNVAGQVSTVMLDTARPPQARAFAAEALGRTGFKGATKGLLAAMRDPDPDVRSRAAEALGRLNQADATQAIVDALRDSHVDVQDAALDALRSWTDSEVDKKLGPLASSAPEDRLKRLAAVAIVLRFLASLEPNADVATVDVRELGAHVKVLAEAAADQTERERVRRVAVTGLGFSGGEAELKVLERLLVPGGPYATRAAVAIARIAKRTAPPARPGEVPTSPATDILLQALPKAQTPDLRLALAGGLAELGQISAQPMVEALAKATGTDRTWLVAILAANGKPAVEPMLETRGRARKAQDVPYWEALDTAMLLTRNSQAREVMDAQPLKQPAPKEFQDTTRQLYIAIMRERAGVEG